MRSSKRSGHLATLTTEDSWSWAECRAFYLAYLNVDVRPPTIDNIICMRNKMAHLRDELRTQAGVAEFERRLSQLAISGPATSEETALGLYHIYADKARGVQISQLETYRVLGLVRSQVDGLTRHLHSIIYGGATTPQLEALRSGAPIAVKGFDYKKRLYLHRDR